MIYMTTFGTFETFDLSVNTIDMLSQALILTKSFLTLQTLEIFFGGLRTANFPAELKIRCFWRQSNSGLSVFERPTPSTKFDCLFENYWTFIISSFSRHFPSLFNNWVFLHSWDSVAQKCSCFWTSSYRPNVFIAIMRSIW